VVGSETLIESNLARDRCYVPTLTMAISVVSEISCYLPLHSCALERRNLDFHATCPFTHPRRLLFTCSLFSHPRSRGFAIALESKPYMHPRSHVLSL